MPLYQLGSRRPRVHPSAFVAPTASIIGDVEVGEGSSVWYGAVLRGDESAIRIGSQTSIQDNAVVHCSHDLPTVVGNQVTVGHSALLEGCVVEDGALVGMGAILLQRSRLGQGAILAAGSVLREGAEIPGGMLAAGTPAQVKKPVSPDGRWTGGRPVRVYGDLARTHATSLVEIQR
ncbi:MAG: gamma carbonic anhydrase family protein [Candidatus Dormibacteraeota bacterium]|nr:gamma carbonic anhydrase family protein [Candidatus Dormibacteraeota bacterium]